MSPGVAAGKGNRRNDYQNGSEEQAKLVVLQVPEPNPRECTGRNADGGDDSSPTCVHPADPPSGSTTNHAVTLAKITGFTPRLARCVAHPAVVAALPSPPKISAPAREIDSVRIGTIASSSMSNDA